MIEAIVLTVMLVPIGGALLLLRLVVNQFVDHPFMRSEFFPFEPLETDVRSDVREHEFTTGDGVRLHGELALPMSPEIKGVVVFAHEFRGSRRNWRKYAGFLPDDGYAVFAFDFRGCGDSEAPAGQASLRWCTDREVRDLRAAVRAVRNGLNLGEVNVHLFGVSRGAMAALATFAEDASISTTILDGCPGMEFVLEDSMRRNAALWMPPFVLRALPSPTARILARLVPWAAALKAGAWFPQVQRLSPRSSHGPALFIFGERDRYVTPAVARRTFEAYRGRKELWVVPRARHNMAVTVQPEEYRKHVLQHLSSAADSQCDAC